MAKREFLQLAHNYRGQSIGDWWYSYKLDGIRAFWDGGITRGMPKVLVPWANTAKDFRYRERQYATGLWTRYGNVIHAPKFWLDQLPPYSLDGELWSPSYNRQEIVSCTKKLIGDETEWWPIKLYVYDMPPLNVVFADGLIDNINFKKQFRGIDEWLKDKVQAPEGYLQFNRAYKRLQYSNYPAMVRHEQWILPSHQNLAVRRLELAMEKIAYNMDGLILRDPRAHYKCERVHSVLKMKPDFDDEAVIIGMRAGTGRLKGKIGSLRVTWKGVDFEIGTGLTDDERELECDDWAWDHPGEYTEDDWMLWFAIGETITFKYRGLSVAGVPQEARYWRSA